MTKLLRAATKLSGVISKYAPQIAVFFGVAMTVGAVVEAVTATVDAVEVDKENVKKIEEGKIERPKNMFFYRVKTLWRYYFMTAVLLIFGVASILYGTHVQNVRTATVSAMCEAEKILYEQYREKTKEIVGAEKEQEIHDATMTTAKDRLPDTVGEKTQIIVYPDQECMFKDSVTGLFFRSTWQEINEALIELNWKLLSGDRITGTDYAYQFGLDFNDDDHGWDINDGLVHLANPQSVFNSRGAYIVIGPDREKKDIKSWYR